MPTNRTRRDHVQRVLINESMIRTFMAMQRIRCSCTPELRKLFEQCAGCKQWGDWEHELSKAFHCQPWEYPCLEDPAWGNPEPPGSVNHQNWKPDEKARERWRALEQGARELRQRERVARAQQRANGVVSTAPSESPAPIMAAPRGED